MKPAATEMLNPGQCAALDLGRDMVVTAGAGAGKTQVLGLRVLALLEEGRAAIDEIVAFTFTEKAAAEMRERVQRLLLARIAELAPNGDRQRLARLRQAEMEFSRNRISTVHSFCYRLLNEFAWEAGLEPRAPILDERRQASARDDAMRAVLLRGDLARDPALAEALTRLGAAMSLGELRHALQRLLRERHIGGPALELAAKRWAEPELELERRRGEHNHLLRQALAPVMQALADIDFGAVASAAPGDTLREPVLALQAMLDAPDARAMARILLTADGRKARAPRGAKAKWKSEDTLGATRAAWQQAASALLEATSAVPLVLDGEFERRAGALLCDLWGIFQRVQAAYAEACAGGVDFLDLELRSIQLLQQRPDVRDELTRRARFVLIDEYQDTNPTQAQLFNLITQGDLTPGRFFAVGDAKQSIYGFRGSDVSIFNHALQEVPARNAKSGAAVLPLAPPWGLECEDSPEQRGGIIRLRHNYRTVRPLLELGNRIFRRVFDVPNPRPFDALPQDMIAGLADKPADQPVEFHLLPKPSRTDDGDTARRDDEAEFIARRVAELHRQGVPYNDIAILVRRSTRNAEYRSAFARHNLPLMVLGEGGLLDTQEGLDCLNLLCALANPADDIAVLGLLRSPFAGLSDRELTLLALRHPRHLTLLERLRLEQPAENPRAAEFIGRFDRWRLRAGRDTPAMLLSDALADTGYALAVGCGFDGEQRLANVERMIEVVRRMQQEFPGLSRLVRELLNRLESGDSEEQGSPEQDAEGVRLMTAHKSKGLEFDTVIVPDLGGATGGAETGVLRHWPAAPGEPLGIWLRSTGEDSLGDSQCDFFGAMAKIADTQRSEAEEKRVLYVAWTRARNRLLLVGTVRDEFNNDSWAHQLLRAVGIGISGQPSQDPTLQPVWHEGVPRGEPASHDAAIAAARNALEADALQLPQAPDTSLCVPTGRATAEAVLPAAVEFGSLVHAALERRIRAAGAETGLAGDAAKHVERAMEALATLPPAMKTLPEFGLITPQGARRLDLLRVLEGGMYEIVDYKTDRVEGELAQHAEGEHGAQLREYAASLQAMLAARGSPAVAIRTLVCFTGPDNLQPGQRLVEIAP